MPTYNYLHKSNISVRRIKHNVKKGKFKHNNYNIMMMANQPYKCLHPPLGKFSNDECLWRQFV